MLLFLFFNAYLASDNNEHHPHQQSEIHANDSGCYVGNVYISTYLIPNSRICLVNCQFKNIGSKTSPQSALTLQFNDEPNTINIIESCIFQNCSAQNGGAVLIYGQTQSFTNFTNCQFLYNECSNHGGAIYISKSNVNFSNCIFTKNRAILQDQTGVNICYGGSILFENSDGFLVNCTFKNSEIFYGISLNSKGGSVFVTESNRTFIDCLFYDCSVCTNIDSNDPSGGSVMCENSNCEFKFCNFSNNFIKSNGNDNDSDGGALTIRKTTGSIIDCFFVNNSVYSDFGNNFGGAFFIGESDVKISNVCFDSNSILSNYKSAYSQGGAMHIQNTSSIYLISCNFTNNFIKSPEGSSVGNGGAIHMISSNGDFDLCSFVNNSSLYANRTHGGAIYMSNVVSQIRDTCFINNLIISLQNETENGGSAVITFDSNTDFIFCKFVNNSIKALNSFFYGGVIYIEENARFNSCIFVDNKSFSNFQSQGAVFISYNEFDFVNCTFENNIVESSGHSSYSSGGAVFIRKETIGNLENCVFSYNKAITDFGQCYGGAVAVYSSSCNLENCTFNYNNIKAQSGTVLNGGAIVFSDTSTGFCNRCNFNGNNVENNGEAYSGAVFLTASRNFTFCNFTNNSVKCNQAESQGAGGVICIFGSNNMDIIFSNCLFESNLLESISASFGVCIYSENSNLNFLFCDFIKNLGTVVSGNIFGVCLISGGSCHYDQCNFNLNKIVGLSYSSFSQGASIYTSSCYAVFDKTKFISNSVVSNSEADECDSAGICLMGSFGIINQCLFSLNSCETNSNSPAAGGAIFCYRSNGQILLSNFTDNFLNIIKDDTGSFGGAIALRYSFFNFIQCYFVNNYILQNDSSSNGGAIMMFLSNGTFSNCIFMENNATLAVGGALVILNGICIFEKCSFINNNAYGGDDIFIQFSNTDFCIEIRNCTFQKDNFLRGNMRSLLYFNYYASSSYLNVFINNQLIINELNKLVIFDGYLANSVYNFWYFRNNCLFPYDESFYKGNNFNLIDSEGFGPVTFGKAFDMFCVYQYDTFTFISHFFTQSKIFTKSDLFSESLPFSTSPVFSDSNAFSVSNEFTLSNEFSQSNFFTQSQIFTKSDFFTQSKIFTQSSFFTQSKTFSKSDFFTQSSFFTQSKIFSKSDFFTLSKIFTKSDFFTHSKIFTKSDFFTLSKVFTKNNFFTQSKTFSKSRFFTQSKAFTKSDFFTHSNIFIRSHIFTKSDFFTLSKIFTKSDFFTHSKIFIKSHFFTKSDFFTLSKIFTKSEIFTKTDEFSKIESSYPISWFDSFITQDSSFETGSNSEEMIDSNSFDESFTETESVNENNSDFETNESTTIESTFYYETSSLFDDLSESSSFLSETESSNLDFELNDSVLSDSIQISIDSSKESYHSSQENISSMNTKSFQFSISNEEKYSKSDKFSYSISLSEFLIVPNTIKPKKKGIGKPVIIGIVCAIIALILLSLLVIFLVFRKRKKNDENSLKEDQSKLFDETKSNKAQTDNTLNVDDEDRDLNFWL